MLLFMFKINVNPKRSSMAKFLTTLLEDTNTNAEIISYNTLRKCVGWLGVVLPFVLYGGSVLFSDCSEVLPSISHYYYSNMTVFFVGILCAEAFFLITYSGYSRLDNIVTNVAAVFCFGIAIFPTGNDIGYTCLKDGNQFIQADLETLHFMCAGAFFSILASMSIWLFTRSGGSNENKKGNVKPMTPEKKMRNKIYVLCGVVMILSEVIILIHHLFFKYDLSNPKLTFWFETLMLVMFGISWLTKGEVISADKK